MVAELILIPQDPKSPDQAKGCAQYVARALSGAGFQVREQISLCTGRTDFQKAVATALGRSNVVLVLGGLSAEQGYLSKQVICKGLNLPLEPHQGCLDSIRAFCEKNGEFFLPEDARLAEIPQGAAVFPGQQGKVPGIIISSAKQHIILMPDNQAEAAVMVPQYIIPYLSGDAKSTITRTVRTYGLNAEQVRASLCELLDTANPAVTVEKEGNEVLVRVSAHDTTSSEASGLCTPVLQTIVERLGDAAYGLDVDSLQSAVIGKLKKKHLSLSLVESGTGGIVARVLSETPGGAGLLVQSGTADDDQEKEKLNVTPKLLKKHGGVSEQAAVQMANAMRVQSGSDLGVAVTACTSEAQKSRSGSVGLVYIAVCDANNVLVKKLVVGSGDPGERDIIIDAALSRALNMVRLFVDYLPRAYSGSIPLSEALAGKTVTNQAASDVPGDNGEKSGFLSKIAGNFIIRKADEPREKVRKFVFLLAVLVFIGSAAYVGNYYYESYVAAKQAKALAELFSYGDDADIEISADFPDDFLASFAALWSINPDVVGYLSIDGTPLQYPVVQSYDNDYYLRRDFYEKSNQYGIPFMDYRVEVDRPSDNMVIYGHNMKDGQMFGELVKYRGLDYYKEHPVIDFSTIYSQDQYKIISIFITNAYEAQGTPLFDYHNFINAKDDADFMQFVEAVRVRSLINTPVDVQPGDKLLTLSTCEYDFTEARLVVVARQVRIGEDPSVDVSQAALNPNPLYPDIWYSLYGGSKPNVPNSTIVTEPSVNRAPSASSQHPSSSASVASTTSSSAPVSSTSEAASANSTAPESTSESESSQLPSASESASSQPESQQSQAPASSSQPESSAPTDGEPTLFDNLPAQEETSYEEIAAYRASESSLERTPVFASKVNVSAISVREPTLFDFIDDPPQVDDNSNSGFSGFGSHNVESSLTVSYNGKVITGDAQEIISRIVQAEVGPSFHEEAIKAQAVAAYSYVLYYNNMGQTPAVVLASANSVHNKVSGAVSQVLGECVYYDGKVALTSYYATSAGQTTSSEAVWGGALPYLVSVDSSVDKNAPNYKMQRRYTSEQISAILEQKLGIETYGDPEDWFEILTYADGGYVEKMSICGETQSQRTGNTITGRMLRESVFGLRSAYFKINYDADTDTFAFITYGYGHGVGMSQNGAHLYAQQGWDYLQILEHYYPGTTVR